MEKRRSRPSATSRVAHSRRNKEIPHLGDTAEADVYQALCVDAVVPAPRSRTPCRASFAASRNVMNRLRRVRQCSWYAQGPPRMISATSETVTGCVASNLRIGVKSGTPAESAPASSTLGMPPASTLPLWLRCASPALSVLPVVPAQATAAPVLFRPRCGHCRPRPGSQRQTRMQGRERGAPDTRIQLSTLASSSKREADWGGPRRRHFGSCVRLMTRRDEVQLGCEGTPSRSSRVLGIRSGKPSSALLEDCPVGCKIADHRCVRGARCDTRTVSVMQRRGAGSSDEAWMTSGGSQHWQGTRSGDSCVCCMSGPVLDLRLSVLRFRKAPRRARHAECSI